MIIPGTRIRDFREVAGWSTGDLARACQFRESYLLDIEAGNVLKVHSLTYQKIADALGITLPMLNGDEEVPVGMSLEDEVPEEYRWLVRNIIYLVVILGTQVIILALIVSSSLVLQTVFGLW